ncbi:MAG: NADH-quinone oxidoreductase subunit A [Thermoplasmata archaeon]
MLLEDYLPVLIFAFICILFPVFTYFLSRLFRPQKRTPLKDTTYECGEVPIGVAQVQFTFQYYIFAILFVAFDVVAVFLVLWALVFSPEMSYVGIASLVAFVAMVGLAVGVSLRREEKILV